MDPNLARLAAAYREAVARLGADGLPDALTPDGLTTAAPGDSSDDEEAALADEAAIGAEAATMNGRRGGRGRNAKMPTRSGGGDDAAAEDLFEGLDAILSEVPGGGGVADAEDEADGDRRAAKRGRSAGGRRAAAPQLSEHADFAKHAGKLPPEALAKGAAVTKNVSRRPIGAPSSRAAAGRRPAAKAAAAAAEAGAPAAVTAEHANGAHADGAVRAAADAAAVGLASELEAATSSGKQGELFGGNTKAGKKRSGAIGGRLRKKLAKQRAAAAGSEAAPTAAAP